MPLTELHGLAKRNEINKENIQEHIGDINTVNEEDVYGEDDYGGECETVYVFSTPLHVALLQNNRTAALFLIAYGGDIHLEFMVRGEGAGWIKYTAESYARDCCTDLIPLVIGGADNARDILISEGLLEEGKKFVKPAKH